MTLNTYSGKYWTPIPVLKVGVENPLLFSRIIRDFGRVEAHEATTAYGREKLLEAKEIAEARGFSLIHAIVDSLWLRKEGATHKDYKELVETISKETGIPIALEGIYRWIGFLPSCTDPKVPVPKRFYGVFYGGRIKVRGLELRRSDTPPLVREAQGKMLEILAQAKNRKEYLKNIPMALEILQDYLFRLRAGEIESKDLVITKACLPGFMGLREGQPGSSGHQRTLRPRDKGLDRRKNPIYNHGCLFQDKNRESQSLFPYQP